MTIQGKFSDQSVSSFHAYSRGEIVRNLDVMESRWKWKVLPDGIDGYSLKFKKQTFCYAYIISGENLCLLEAVSRSDIHTINVVFVLSGEVYINSKCTHKSYRIPSGHYAGVCQRGHFQISMKSKSAWFILQIPESMFRKYFEEVSLAPYAQEFSLPLMTFSQGDTQGLYSMLQQAEKDLEAAQPSERALLARAYEDLLLVKLFAKLPHSISRAFDGGASQQAPRQLLKAETFMRENLHNPITLEDIASAAGCGVRALQRMFRMYRRDTPIGALCSFRLSAAHGLIKGGQTNSITDLALSLQFSNPGRFSVLYKSAYGFTPSSIMRLSRES
ncbi:helix-turn-helix domain-containing protein [Mesorhizobium sp. NPDC059025]|uniref:helix-turn-helix domain-containing protein n=1 Tax=unclassified Mesorhizobium TaxID=325217 RepID=UPI003672C861